MPFRSRAVSRGRPRTNVGRWLRAMLLRQTELRERLRFKLNGGKLKGWNDDEPAVVQAACELAVSRFFGTGYDVRAITAFAAELREATAPMYEQLKTEAVIRSALGEQDVDTEGITASQKHFIRGMVVLLVCGKLRFGAEDAGSGALRFTQTTASATFRNGPFAGRTIGDIAAALRSGAVKPGELPIDLMRCSAQALATGSAS